MQNNLWLFYILYNSTIKVQAFHIIQQRSHGEFDLLAEDAHSSKASDLTSEFFKKKECDPLYMYDDSEWLPLSFIIHVNYKVIIYLCNARLQKQLKLKKYIYSGDEWFHFIQNKIFQFCAPFSKESYLFYFLNNSMYIFKTCYINLPVNNVG